jgi:molybdopterin synthase sulfur carrier subunit
VTARIAIQLKLFANLRDKLPPGAERGQARIEIEAGTTLKALIESLGVPLEEAAIVVVNGRTTVSLDALVNEGDVVSIFPPVAGGSGFRAELIETGPQPDCLSLDPGTRVKTHVIRCYDAAGALAWERSLYSQYDTRELLTTDRAVIIGYDDRLVALDPENAAERHSYRLFLFDYFERVSGDRILAKERGSVLLLDASGAQLWEHGAQEILGGMLVHEGFVFLHFWGGSEVDGVRVPFLCLALDTGKPDLKGPPTAPDFEQLVSPADIVGPRQKEGRAELASGAKLLLETNPSPWVKAMWEHVQSVA